MTKKSFQSTAPKSLALAKQKAAEYMQTKWVSGITYGGNLLPDTETSALQLWNAVTFDNKKIKYIVLVEIREGERTESDPPYWEGSILVWTANHDAQVSFEIDVEKLK